MKNGIITEYFTSMTYIHRTLLGKTWKGYKHIAQLWYIRKDPGYPSLQRIDMYRIEKDGTVGDCVSSVTENGIGENRLTLDDRFTGLMILIDDGVLNWELGI